MPAPAGRDELGVDRPVAGSGDDDLRGPGGQRGQHRARAAVVDDPGDGREHGRVGQPSVVRDVGRQAAPGHRAVGPDQHHVDVGTLGGRAPPCSSAGRVSDRPRWSGSPAASGGSPGPGQGGTAPCPDRAPRSASAARGDRRPGSAAWSGRRRPEAAGTRDRAARDRPVEVPWPRSSAGPRGSNRLPSTTTAGTPARAAARGPAPASGSCSDQVGPPLGHERERALGHRARPPRRTSADAVGAARPCPHHAGGGRSGCRSSEPPRAPPAASDPGTTSCTGAPARRPASSPSPPVATRTSWPASRNAAGQRHQRQHVPHHRGGDEERPHARQVLGMPSGSGKGYARPAPARRGSGTASRGRRSRPGPRAAGPGGSAGGPAGPPRTYWSAVSEGPDLRRERLGEQDGHRIVVERQGPRPERAR